MSHPSRLGLAAVFVGLCAAAPAYAQSKTPPLATMPMPPSFNDPAPKEGTTTKPSTTRRAAKARSADDAAAPAPKGRAAASSDRFSREEIDDPNGASGGGGSRVAPFLSESGRAGLGGRF